MDNCSVIVRGEAVYPPSFPLGNEKTGGEGPPPRGKSRWAWVWGIGGSLLSVLGFLGLTLFEQYNNSINELQRDLKHFNEVSSEFVKKDHFKHVFERLTDYTKELQQSAAARTRLEKELEACQTERHEALHELQLMRRAWPPSRDDSPAPPVVLISTPDKK